MTRRTLCVSCVLVCFFTVFGFAAPSKKKARASIPAGKTDWSEIIFFDFREKPLREVFASFAESRHFSFFLDRRVDTEIPVTYAVDSVPLLKAMTELAESVDLEAVRLGSRLLYVGPRGSAGELLLLAATHRGELSKLEARFTPKKSKGVIFPSEVLKESGKEVGVTWSGLDRMPFDCWYADALAPLTYRELFSLVLIGYGVDYQVGGTESKPVLKPVKIDRAASVTRQWKEGDILGLNPETFPDVTLTLVRSEVRAVGPFDQMARLEYFVAKNREAKEIAESPRFHSNDLPAFRSGENRSLSGEVRQTKLAFLSELLKKKIGVELRLDPSLDDSGITMETRISCEFRDADRAKAVKIIAEELHVDYLFHGNVAILLKKQR
jgi:hypothetical protein